MVGKQHAYVLVRDWLGEPQPVDRDAALAELARRYLAGHGPADDRDLARWAGLPLRDARAGLGGDRRASSSEREDGLVDLRRPRRRPRRCRRRACSAPSTRCCSAGPRARKSSARTRCWSPINGLFRPFALVDGRAVATWGLAGGKVTIEHLGKVTKEGRRGARSRTRSASWSSWGLTGGMPARGGAGGARWAGPGPDLQVVAHR